MQKRPPRRSGREDAFCLNSDYSMVMQLQGHTAAQLPQRTHFSGWIRA